MCIEYRDRHRHDDETEDEATRRGLVEEVYEWFDVVGDSQADDE